MLFEETAPSPSRLDWGGAEGIDGVLSYGTVFY